MRSGNDGASSYCARIRHCESYSKRSELLRQLQGSLAVRAIRLRLATGLPFPTFRSPARGLSPRLEHAGWLVQTRSRLLKASALYDLSRGIGRDHAGSANTGRLIGGPRSRISINPA